MTLKELFVAEMGQCSTTAKHDTELAKILTRFCALTSQKSKNPLAFQLTDIHVEDDWGRRNASRYSRFSTRAPLEWVLESLQLHLLEHQVTRLEFRPLSNNDAQKAFPPQLCADANFLVFDRVLELPRDVETPYSVVSNRSILCPSSAWYFFERPSIEVYLAKNGPWYYAVQNGALSGIQVPFRTQSEPTVSLLDSVLQS